MKRICLLTQRRSTNTANRPGQCPGAWSESGGRQNQKRYYSISDKFAKRPPAGHPAAQAPFAQGTPLKQQQRAPAGKPVLEYAEPEAPSAPADIVPLKERSVADRLNDPNLLFDGEEEVPSAQINLLKELHQEFLTLVDSAEEALQDPDVQLYERVAHARTKMLELKWLANPEPPSATNRMALEAEIKQMLADTDIEFDEYLDMKYAKSIKEQVKARKMLEKFQREQRIAIATEKLMTGKKLKRAEAREQAKKVVSLNKPLYKDYDRMEPHRSNLISESNDNTLASIDKILAHRKMVAAEKRRQELEMSGQTFADVAPENIPIEHYAQVAKAAEKGRSPFDWDDQDDEVEYETVETVDPKTGKKKKEKRRKSVIEVKPEDDSEINDKKLEEEDFAEAMAFMQNGNPDPKEFDFNSPSDDPAWMLRQELAGAKTGFKKRHEDILQLERRRKERLEEAKAKTLEAIERSARLRK